MADQALADKIAEKTSKSELSKTLIERAKQIAPNIAKRAEAAEAERRIPDETIQEVTDAELFHTTSSTLVLTVVWHHYHAMLQEVN